MRGLWGDFLAAVQFLTRIPVPSRPGMEPVLARALVFFPLIGAVLGAVGGGFGAVLDMHLPRLVVGAMVVTLLALMTGCLHEDGLADAVDGFGGGWTKEQTLAIFRDSRIGSYGGTALALSLVLRVVLIASLPTENLVAVLITAHVLCRWTALPLGYWLPPARESVDGLGARVAQLTSGNTLFWGSFFSLVCVGFAMRWHALAPLLAAVAVSGLSGLYYQRRIGGVTGDCFGATNQMTEIAVYLCGAWVA